MISVAHLRSSLSMTMRSSPSLQEVDHQLDTVATVGDLRDIDGGLLFVQNQPMRFRGWRVERNAQEAGGIGIGAADQERLSRLGNIAIQLELMIGLKLVLLIGH